MISFDEFLEKFIGSGTFQVLMFMIISLINFVDAIEGEFQPIFLSIVASQWGFSVTQIIGIGTSFHIGMSVGNIFCALYADTVGRKNSLIMGAFLTFLTFLVNSQVRFYWEVFLLRLIFGIALGAILPLSSILLCEMVTKEIRGRIQAYLTIVQIIGEIYLILSCMIFLDDFQSGNWRGLLLFNSLPALFCFLASCMYLKESARFYISKGRFVEGFQVLMFMGQINQGEGFQLTSQQKDNLILWQIHRFSSQNKASVTLKSLLNDENRSLTLKLSGIFGMSTMAWYLLNLLIPFWLQDGQSNGFISLLYIYFAELVSAVILSQIIDKKEFGGRLKIIKICLTCMAITSFSMYLYPNKVLVVGLIFYKFFAGILYPCLNIFANENYSTLYRSLGLGFIQAVARITASLSPTLAFSMYSMDAYYPFIAISFCLIIALIIASTIKFDMSGQNLDQDMSSIIQ